MTLRLKGFCVRTRAAPVPQTGVRQWAARRGKGNELAGAPGDTLVGAPAM
jgi:hypothetical protein